MATRNDLLKQLAELKNNMAEIFNLPIDLLQTMRDIELFIRTERSKDDKK